MPKCSRMSAHPEGLNEITNDEFLTRWAIGRTMVRQFQQGFFTG